MNTLKFEMMNHLIEKGSVVISTDRYDELKEIERIRNEPLPHTVIIEDYAYYKVIVNTDNDSVLDLAEKHKLSIERNANLVKDHQEELSDFIKNKRMLEFDLLRASTRAEILEKGKASYQFKYRMAAMCAFILTFYMIARSVIGLISLH